MAQRRWAHDEIVAGVREGDSRAIARAISLAEDRDPRAAAVVADLYPETGSAFAVGVTGPPGAGKSSLISALVRHLRAGGQSVGVISVDPSSPFTRGALLGDRIRLSDHFLDPGVYIRSMGTRGHPGGLAEATLEALLILDASGCDVVFLETVGAGQSEVEVTTIADEVLLVLMPGSGDAVQALKAGIMEIPDVIAVNKKDLPGAETLRSDVRSVLALAEDTDERAPLVLTDAIAGEGVVQLWDALVATRDGHAETGELERRREDGLVAGVMAVATARMRSRLERAVVDDPALASLFDAVRRREVDPLAAVDRLVAALAPVGGP